MAGNLIGEPFRSYVNDQIKIRQEVHGKRNRSIQEIQYLNSRNAWIKLASAVSVEQKRLDLLTKQNDRGNPLLDNIRTGQDLAIQYVLFNGLTRFGSSKIGVSSGNLTEEQAAAEDYEKYLPSKTINTFKQIQRAGVGGSNGAYGVGGTDFGYSPMPGIIDMNFKCLNRGSIKKATLNIKVHNKNQFDIIDTLYLRLGYSVFLEWGYDKYIDNNGDLKQMEDTLIDGPFWQDKFSKSDYSKWLPEIENLREETNGNYEGAFGTVSNFSWTFEDDGTYNIKLEIINLGDVIESLKVNLPIVGAGGENPYLSAKLAALQNKSDPGADAEFGTFYSQLWPGLEQAVREWFTSKKGTAPSVTIPLNKLSRIKFENKDSSVPEYTNPNGLADDNFKFNTSEENDRRFFSGAIQHALQTQYFGNTTKNGIGNEFRERYQKLSNNLLGEVASYTKNQSGRKTDRRMWQWWYMPYPNKVSNLGTSFSFTIWGGGNTLTGNQTLNTVWANKTWVNKYNSLNNDLKWEMLVNNIVPANYGEGSDFGILTKTELNYSPTLKNILDGVYQYFKKEGKAKIIPLDEGEQAIQDIKEKEFKNNNLNIYFDSLAEQELQDRINKNKNRIYRFFYDIRSQFAFEKQQQLKNNLSTQGKDLQSLIDDGVANDYSDALDLTLDIAYLKIKLANEATSQLKNNLDTLQDVIGTRDLKPKKTTISILDNDGIGSGIQFDRKLKRKQFAIEELQKSNPNLEYITNTTFTHQELAIARYELANVDNQYYMRLGFFLDWINHNVIPRIDSTNPGKPMIQVDTDTDINICYVIDNALSLNTKKCISNNDYFTQGLTNPEDPNTGVKRRIYGGLNRFIVKSINSNDIFWGQIMNVYFSFNRLEEIFDSTNEKNEVSLYKTLKDICNDINECFGNINNIEPIIDENNVVKFIDQTSIPNLDIIAKELQLPDFNPPKEAILEIYGYNTNKNTSNFVRKVGLTTEISKNYATMITIGATANGSIPGAEATAFSRWNIGLKDRFKNNIFDSKESNYDMNSPITSSISQTTLTSYANFINTSTYEIVGLNSDKPHTFNEDFIELNTEVAENYYKLYQAETSIKEENPIESSIGFLPFNLKLDLDGIGGIKIYNRVKVNTSFLPSNYPETLEFIITGVNHKLSDNDWVTSLETTATSTNTQTKRKK